MIAARRSDPVRAEGTRAGSRCGRENGASRNTATPGGVSPAYGLLLYFS